MDDEDDGLQASGLLSRLHNFYRPGRKSYEKEDLLTEYLAWLLNRSRRFRVAFAELALNDSAGVAPGVFSDAEALTQVDTGGTGWIDLVLEVTAAPDVGASEGSPKVVARLGVECKVDLTLEKDSPAGTTSGSRRRRSTVSTWLSRPSPRGDLARRALSREKNLLTGREGCIGTRSRESWSDVSMRSNPSGYRNSTRKRRSSGCRPASW